MFAVACDQALAPGTPYTGALTSARAMPRHGAVGTLHRFPLSMHRDMTYYRSLPFLLCILHLPYIMVDASEVADEGAQLTCKFVTKLPKELRVPEAALVRRLGEKRMDYCEVTMHAPLLTCICPACPLRPCQPTSPGMACRKSSTTCWTWVSCTGFRTASDGRRIDARGCRDEWVTLLDRGAIRVLQDHPWAVPWVMRLAHETWVHETPVEHGPTTEMAKPFDFLINHELLRGTLQEHLSARGASAEVVTEIEYIPLQLPPSPGPRTPHDDWCAGFMVRPIALLASSLRCAGAPEHTRAAPCGVLLTPSASRPLA